MEDGDDNITVHDVLKGALGQVAVTMTTQVVGTTTRSDDAARKDEDEILLIGQHDDDDSGNKSQNWNHQSHNASNNTIGFRWMQSTSMSPTIFTTNVIHSYSTTVCRRSLHHLLLSHIHFRKVAVTYIYTFVSMILHRKNLLRIWERGRRLTG